MRQYINWEEAARAVETRTALAPAWLESLQSLQEAYEAWKMTQGGVGVTDLFWSWNLQV